MNIKINIGGNCDCSPAVITKKQMSEVQFKKKNMLYAPPTKDKKVSQSSNNHNQHNNTNNHNNGNKKTAKTITTSQNNISQSNNNHPQYNQQTFLQAQRKLVNDLSQITRTQNNQDMINHTGTILQRQNQIIQSNQKTIQNLIQQKQQPSRRNIDEGQSSQKVKKMFQESADKIAKQVKQIKKMRDQILQAGEQFKRLLNQQNQDKNVNLNINKGSQQIGNMNNNLKNLVEISKNHIQGLQNLQGIKNLQNFNIQAYTQAIYTLKKQIIQYQKQSQNIQRQLKLRSAKLQKLQISPNFDQQLLQPYEQYLRKKASNIDLHAIKQRVYQKLGQFDYGKFEYDTTLIMNDVKNQLGEFNIIFKQYKIDVPDIKIDQKEIKMLELKLPSVLDQFKQSRGIVFIDKEIEQSNNKQKGRRNVNMNTKKSQQLHNALKDINKNMMKRSTDNLQSSSQQQQRQNIKHTNYQPSTKPIDYSNQVKLTRLDKQKYSSVLQTKVQKQKKQVQQNIKQNSYKNNRNDEQFEKYLQNRAREQLAVIYQQKRKKLKQMEKNLYETCKQQVKPVYELKLDIKNRLEVNKSKQKKKQLFKEQVEDQYYQDDFEEKPQKKEQIKKNNNKPLSKQEQQLKSVGTQVLRQKLKNLFSKQNTNNNTNEPIHMNNHMLPPQQALNNQSSQMQSMATGFINMINNTLTQINNQLSSSIQKKIQLSSNNRSISKQRQFEHKIPNKIVIPKLQQFRAPPVFNMQLVQEPVYGNMNNMRQPQIKKDKKIVKKDYQHLRIKEENDSDLEVSAMSFDD